jgi:hypothetical protein
MRSSFSIWVLAALFGVAVPTFGSDARAQPLVTTADASAQADALNKRAVEALKRDGFADAEPLARQAWELKQSYDIASNLGLAELGLKRNRDAAEHLAFALRTFPANGKPEHKKLVEMSLSRAAAEVGAVELSVNVDGATVYVDAKRIGVAPLRGTVFLDPGPHTLRAELAGYDAAQQDVRAQPGRADRVSLALTRTPAPPTSTAAMPPPPAARAKKSLPLIVTGFGLAAAGVAVGVGGVIASSSSSSSATAAQDQLAASDGQGACNLPANASACSNLDGSLKDVGTYRNLSIAGFAVGGAALIGTVVYLLVPAGPTQPPLRAGVSAGPDGAQWTLRGSF